jgi:hypothetical protein
MLSLQEGRQQEPLNGCLPLSLSSSYQSSPYMLLSRSCHSTSYFLFLSSCWSHGDLGCCTLEGPGNGFKKKRERPFVQRRKKPNGSVLTIRFVERPMSWRVGKVVEHWMRRLSQSANGNRPTERLVDAKNVMPIGVAGEKAFSFCYQIYNHETHSPPRFCDAIRLRRSIRSDLLFQTGGLQSLLCRAASRHARTDGLSHSMVSRRRVSKTS